MERIRTLYDSKGDVMAVWHHREDGGEMQYHLIHSGDGILVWKAQMELVCGDMVRVRDLT